MHYVLLGKDETHSQGKLTLVSYAQCPLWKTYEELLRQADTPSKLTLQEGKRVLGKYANVEAYHLIPYSEFKKDFKEYIQTK